MPIARTTTRILAVAATALTISSCSSDDIFGTEDVAGVHSLSRVNGQALPAAFASLEGCDRRIASGHLELTDEEEFLMVVEESVHCAASTPVSVQHSFAGRYSVVGARLRLDARAPRGSTSTYYGQVRAFSADVEITDDDFGGWVDPVKLTFTIRTP